MSSLRKSDISTKKFFKPKTKKFGKLPCILYRNYLLISLNFSFITLKQIETLRRFISRFVFKKLPKIQKLQVCKVLTKKASKARMGKGRGKFFKFYGVVTPGTPIFEFSCYYPHSYIKSKLNGLFAKLPFKFKLLHNKIFYI